MTKKHFAAIAAAIAAERQRQIDATASPSLVAAVDLVAIRLAAALATFNSNFDRARFLAACRGE